MAIMAGKPDKRPFWQVLIMWLFKATYGLYVKLQCNVKMVKNSAYRTKGPYILLANHVHNLDPIFIQYYWPRIICYVTNDTVWKVKALRWILDSVGLIPKMKNTTDSAAVRGILTNVKKGRIIGIFPEGMRSWDGVTKTVIPSTASLIKKLKLPVVTVKIKGAMMSRPRWSNTNRKGKVVLEPMVTLTAEQVKQKTADEILDVIVGALSYDETAYLQANPQLRHKSKAPAEDLELFLYMCKTCGAKAQMRSKSSTFACTACGASYSFNRDASLTAQSTGGVTTLSAWDAYQKQCMADELAKAKADTVLFADADVMLYEYIRLQPLKLLTTGAVRMQKKGMIFVGQDGETRVFEATRLDGTNVQKNAQLEFTYDERTYRFFFKPRVSPYKWQQALMLAAQQ